MRRRRRRRLLAEILVEDCEGKRVHPNKETTISHNSEIDADQNQVLILDDLLIKILILLPSESLFSAQFVSKKCFSLINSSTFIRFHAQKCETVLICTCSTSLKKPSHGGEEENEPKHYHFRFLDLFDGRNSFVESSLVVPLVIQVSYDGLILATTRYSNELMLINPVTKKHAVLPLSTDDRPRFQSFGIAYCKKEKTYKIIHTVLFKESGGLICNIMSIHTRRWRRIEEPHLWLDITQAAVSVEGSLHWMSLKEGCDYFVSLSLNDEKFVPKNLPVCRGLEDHLLEIGGYLGLVTQMQMEMEMMMQVWILVGENWMKKYSINVNINVGGGELFHRAVPVCCWRNGKGIVVEKANGLYVHNLESGEMRLIHSSLDQMNHVAHRNTLVAIT
ncbi:hypothetical protein C2S52_014204 [Perilla frutescens var. hirtella]|nr:hypothetical protein C2S52_014204 [Perilla frutescens var. hirtella]